MLTALQYGNAAAYFDSGSATGFLLGRIGGFMGKRPVSVYSVVRMETQGLSTANRIAAPSAAVIGWLGCQPVAFPMVAGWNADTPIT